MENIVIHGPLTFHTINGSMTILISMSTASFRSIHHWVFSKQKTLFLMHFVLLKKSSVMLQSKTNTLRSVSPSTNECTSQ